MQTRNGFTRFDNISEFKTWLNNKTVTRKVTRLQVHHMGLPDYSCFYKNGGKTEDELTRTINLDSYGKSMGWGGIAQHLNIFPNGKITTGRSLNKTPVGITGWNTNAICIEIYGDFDNGKDKMTDAQKKAVIAVYGELCKKFKLTPSANTIRAHAWFTSGGTYLGGYYPSKAAKSCPGTGFTKAFGGLVDGYGNSKDAFEKYFYPRIKAYIKGEDKKESALTTSSKKFQVKVLSDTLNVRKIADWNAEPITKVKKGQHLDVVAEVDAKNGSTNMYKLESGLYITASSKYVKKV